MPYTNSADEYDALLGALYQGALEATPWQSFLPRLLDALGAMVVSLTLRPPRAGDTGSILNYLRPYTTADGHGFSKADPRDWPSTAYREQFFALDPFVDLPPLTVVSLQELIPLQELRQSEYYRQFLEPAGILHILAADAREPRGMEARLRVSRGPDDAPFSRADRRLLERLLPHLARALEINARLAHTESERALYEGAVDQLAVGTIILDGHGRVLNSNRVAGQLLALADGMHVGDGQLRFADMALGRQLQQVIAKVLEAHLRGAPAMVEALRVRRPSGKGDFGLVIRPVPRSAWSEGQSSPTVAVFVSAPELQSQTSELVIRQLFDFTPAESRLALRLAGGQSLAEACDELCISPHTARAQLKTIFAKSGVTRQAELVRLILRSVATLA
jgi:DNA-binding CsgD family transcriptional regulator/PAS domain-containing protein